jgi:hypothetical protein
MHKSLFCALFVMVLIPFFFFGFLQDSPEYSLNEALKILGLIDKLQLEQLEKGNRDLKNIVVTEDELNSYIAHRIKVEQEETLRELRLKMYDNNKVEWKIMLDLEGAKLPNVLMPQMTFYLGGILEVEEGYVRLDLKDLYLGNKRIQVSVFELVIFIGSKIIGSEPFSMSDWWLLPYGIKDIKTQKGKAAFYY